MAENKCDPVYEKGCIESFRWTFTSNLWSNLYMWAIARIEVYLLKLLDIYKSTIAPSTVLQMYTIIEYTYL